jgi:hypothetical protein
VVRQSNSASRAVLAFIGGDSRSACKGKLTRNAFRIRETMRVASSECPLMRKSYRPRPADRGQALQPESPSSSLHSDCAGRPKTFALICFLAKFW